MQLPKALGMWAINDTMAFVADSIGGTKSAPAQMSWHFGHPKPALLNWQEMSTHPKIENGSELCDWKGQLIIGGGGGDSLRPYSQQRPMRTNLSCCLGLIDNGQQKSTNRLLVVVPHERPHGIMRILKNLCMLLPKVLKMWAIKDTTALVADSIGGTKCAPAQMSWHLGHAKPALLNWQEMSTHPKMENGSELCDWKGQLIVGLSCVS